MNCELREKNIISAAGYLTNYHASTTEPLSSIGHGYSRGITPSPFQHQETDMHLRPYINHHRMEYGLPPAHFLNCQPPSSQRDYKPVPSKRFNPYIANVNSAHLSLHDSSTIPRNVSLSNSSVKQLTTSPMIPASLPTSLNRCNNCDQICQEAIHRSNHYSTAGDSSGHNISNRPGSHEEKEAFPNEHVIDRKLYDILDLDSHKMVYLPSVDSQVCNHHNTFIPPRQQQIKHVLLLTNQPNYQEFSTSVIEPEYFLHQPQIGHQQQQDANSFNDAASQVIPSRSELPQAYGEQYAIPFEAATSTLPTSAPKGKNISQITKSQGRAKICKCTACDKWFPSPAHLKRHYNTNLHKKSVEATVQSDPAAVLISHHVTSCEQDNNSIHRGSNGQGLSAPPQSQDPEYSSQYLPPLKYQVIQRFPKTQGFPAVHSTIGSSANGQASHSILVSQSEGILNSLNSAGTCQVFLQQEKRFLESTTESHLMNSQDQYNTTNLITINTNTASYPTNIQPKLLHPDSITTDHTNEMSEMLSVNDYSSKFSSYKASVPYAKPNCLLMGGATAYQGDDTSYYSQDIPETMFQHNRMTMPSVATISPSTVSSSISSTEIGINTMETMCACTLCDKVFNKACYLKQHNKTFHSGAQFKCTKCGKRFSSKIRRDQHLEKHNGIKPFSCEYDDCEKSFNHKADLQRHITVHTGQLQHVCEKCSKAFVRKDHMLKHMKTRGCKPIVNGKKVQSK